MEMARSTIAFAELRKEFWGEAMNTSVHILDRIPSKAINDKTPWELFFGHKPFVSYFKIFGCIAFVHIPDHLRKKVDSKAQKTIFVGHSSTSKA